MGRIHFHPKTVSCNDRFTFRPEFEGSQKEGRRTNWARTVVVLKFRFLFPSPTFFLFSPAGLLEELSPRVAVRDHQIARFGFSGFIFL